MPLGMNGHQVPPKRPLPNRHWLKLALPASRHPPHERPANFHWSILYLENYVSKKVNRACVHSVILSVGIRLVDAMRLSCAVVLQQ